MRTALVIGMTAAILGLAGTGVLAHQATDKPCPAGQQCPQGSGGHGMHGQGGHGMHGQGGHGMHGQGGHGMHAKGEGHGMHGQARMAERHQRMAERHQRMHGGEAKQDEHKEHKH